MKQTLFFFLLAIVGLAFWGCPTKKYVPDPTPPQPQVKLIEDYPGYLGREPYVGPKIQFERMIASWENEFPFLKLTNFKDFKI